MNTHGFDFETVRAIHLAPGAAARLGEIVASRIPPARTLVVTDPGVVKLGLIDESLKSLSKCGFEPVVFDGVVADPPDSIVLQAIDFARRERVGAVIGFGGGSSMDVAKLVAVLTRSEQTLSQIYGIGKVVGGRLPLVMAPTTAGTGSEATAISIVTTGETTKMGIVAPQLYADLAVLDPSLTVGLPGHVTAATGIDAMVHAIEAYTSRHKKNPMSDMLAVQALNLLYPNIVQACQYGDDMEARTAMLLGACLAGQAFANAPVAAVHALAYPIGGRFHVSHGLSNALVLPYVLEFNMPVAAELYAELARLLGIKAAGSDEVMAAGFVDAIRDVSAATGIERRLSEVGITRGDLPTLAEDAMQQTRLLVNNPREVVYEDALDIYRKAL